MEQKFSIAATTNASNFYCLTNNAIKFGFKCLKISTFSVDFSFPKAIPTQETIVHKVALGIRPSLYQQFPLFHIK